MKQLDCLFQAEPQVWIMSIRGLASLTMSMEHETDIISKSNRKEPPMHLMDSRDYGERNEDEGRLVKLTQGWSNLIEPPVEESRGRLLFYYLRLSPVLLLCPVRASGRCLVNPLHLGWVDSDLSVFPIPGELKRSTEAS